MVYDVVPIYLCKYSIKPVLSNIRNRRYRVVRPWLIKSCSRRFNDRVTSHWNKNELFKWGIICTFGSCRLVYCVSIFNCRGIYYISQYNRIVIPDHYTIDMRRSVVVRLVCQCVFIYACNSVCRPITGSNVYYLCVDIHMDKDINYYFQSTQII